MIVTYGHLATGTPITVHTHPGSQTGLVVDRVEGGYEVEPPGAVEGGSMLADEAGISQTPPVGLGGRGGEPGVGDVEPGEAAGRERGGHEVDRVAGSAADVGDVDAGLQALDEAGWMTGAPWIVGGRDGRER